MAARHPSSAQYLGRLSECVMKKKTAPEQMVCVMGLGCKQELVMYSRCLIQYQKSRFLCKVPKRELMDCYQNEPRSVNLSLN